MEEASNIYVKNYSKMKKENLPQKVCKTCGKNFIWRKKWAKVWEDVKYCSQRCRSNKTKKQ
jgi:hypothetical protein